MLKTISYLYNKALINIFYFFFVKLLQFRIKKIIKKRFYRNWNIKNIDLKVFRELLKKGKLFNNDFSRTNIDIILNSYTTPEILGKKINCIYVYLLYKVSILENKSDIKSYIETNLGFSLKKDLNKVIESEKLGAELFNRRLLSQDKDFLLEVMQGDKSFLTIGKYILYFLISLLVLFFSLTFFFGDSNNINNTGKLKNNIEENKKNNRESSEDSEKKNKTNEEKKSNIGEPEEESNSLSENNSESGSGEIEKNIKKIIENDFSNLKENTDSIPTKIINDKLENNPNNDLKNLNNELPSKITYLKLGIKEFYDIFSMKNNAISNFTEDNKEKILIILKIFLIQVVILLSFVIFPRLFNKNLIILLFMLIPLNYMINSSFATYNLFIIFSYLVIFFFIVLYIFNFIFRLLIGEDNIRTLSIYYKSFRIIYTIVYALMILLLIPLLFYLFSASVFDYINHIYLFDSLQLTYRNATSEYAIYLGIIFFIFMLSFQIFYYNFNYYVHSFLKEYKSSPLSKDLEEIIKKDDIGSFWEGLIDKLFIIEGNKLFLLKFLYIRNKVGKAYFSYLKDLRLSLKNENIFSYKNIFFSFPKNIFYDRIKYIWEEGIIDTSGIRSEDKTSVSFIREKNKFEDTSSLRDRINSKKSRSIGKIVINEYNHLDDVSDNHYYLYINLNTILEKRNLISLNKIFKEIETRKLHIFNIKLFLNSKEYKNLGFISSQKLKYNINEIFNEIKVSGKEIMFPSFLKMKDEKGNIKRKYKKNINNISLYLNGIFGKLDFFRETGKLSLVTNRKNDKENFIYLGFDKDIKIKKAIVY